MPTIEDYKSGDPTTTLLKGPNGFGKTIAAGSYPEPIYFFDIDGRIDPLPSFYRGDRKRQIHYNGYGVHNLFPMLDQFDSVLEHGFLKDLDTGQTIYPGTIVGDGFTSLSITSINYQLNEVRKIAKTRKDAAKRTQGGIVIPDWDEYKGETSIFTQLLDVSKAIPKRRGIHVIWTAHPTKGTAVSKGVDGKVAVTTKVSPIVAIGAKAADLVPGYFNEIYHFAFQPSLSAAEMGRRIVYTQTVGDDTAKTAMLLPPAFDWTWTKKGDEMFYEKLMRLAKRGEEIDGDWLTELGGGKKEEEKGSGW